METPVKAVSGSLLPKGQNLAWGFGSLGTITMISAISSLYLFFLVSIVNIPIVLAGLLITVSKIIDMISDPAMGWISDRTNTRWGRRRPYMFFASFACAAALVFLFSIPTGLGVTATAVYVEIGLIFYALALTAFNVPYLAMPAEMTDDYHERSNIMSYRAAFLVGGSFVGSAIAGLILKTYDGGAEAYRIVGYFVAVVTLIAMLIATLGTGKAKFTTFTRPTIPSINQVKLFLANKPFLVLGGVKAIQFLQISAGGAVTLFFFVNVLQKDEGLLFPFGIAVISGSVLSLRFWLPIIRRFGKRETFIVALFFQALIYLSWLLATNTEPLWLFMIRAFCLGTMSGATLICGQSMITDTMEYDRRLSGINREGTYSAVFSFIEKSMHAAGPLVVSLLLAGLGFDQSIPRGQPQPESAQFAISFGQAILPALCSAGMAFGLFFYSLSEEKLKATTLHDLGQR